MKLASGLQLDTTKSYSIKVADGSEPRHLIDVRDYAIVKSILSLMTRACNSQADVSFIIDKISLDTLGIDVYSIDMYVETNTDVLLDELNAIISAYPSRIRRNVRIRTTRRPDISTLYATCVHIDITTHDYALVPARIDVINIYSPAIPLSRNATTGLFAQVGAASDIVRERPQQFISDSSSVPVERAFGVMSVFGSIFGRSSAMAASGNDEPGNYILVEEDENPRPLKRSRPNDNDDNNKM